MFGGDYDGSQKAPRTIRCIKTSSLDILDPAIKPVRKHLAP